MELGSNNYKVQHFLIAITPWYLRTKINHLSPEVEPITMWKRKYLICVVCSGFLVLIIPSPNWISKKSCCTILNSYNFSFVQDLWLCSNMDIGWGFYSRWLLFETSSDNCKIFKWCLVQHRKAYTRKIFTCCHITWWCHIDNWWFHR